MSELLRITGPTGHTITVDDRPDGARRILIEREGGGGGELILDAESAREVGLALGSHPSDNQLNYSEETLAKVRLAIHSRLPGLSVQAVTGVVSEMQNAGILFRERA